jgi:tRNA(adenine34) deaminase
VTTQSPGRGLILIALCAGRLRWRGRAADAGEVPVGAVLGTRWRNAQIGSHDPDGACRDQLRCARRRRRRAITACPAAILYVTLEPCSMCCGALVHARVAELVFAAPEPRAGAVVSARAAAR